MKTPFFLGLAFLSSLALVTACSDDATDPADDDDGSGAASAGGSGGNGTGGSTTSAGGMGTGGSATSAGGMGSGGDAAGGMGVGGMAQCYTCSAYAQDCQANNACPPESEICPGSLATYNALKTCVCGVCGNECQQQCTGQGQNGPDCQTCLQTAFSCAGQAQACFGDT